MIGFTGALFVFSLIFLSAGPWLELGAGASSSSSDSASRARFLGVGFDLRTGLGLPPGIGVAIDDGSGLGAWEKEPNFSFILGVDVEGVEATGGLWAGDCFGRADEENLSLRDGRWDMVSMYR